VAEVLCRTKPMQLWYRMCGTGCCLACSKTMMRPCHCHALLLDHCSWSTANWTPGAATRLVCAGLHCTVMALSRQSPTKRWLSETLRNAAVQVPHRGAEASVEAVQGYIRCAGRCREVLILHCKECRASSHARDGRPSRALLLQAFDACCCGVVHTQRSTPGQSKMLDQNGGPGPEQNGGPARC
jgi:hypothetical protein